MRRDEVSMSRFSFSHLHNYSSSSLIRSSCFSVSSSIIISEPPALSLCATYDDKNTSSGRYQRRAMPYPSSQNELRRHSPGGGGGGAPRRVPILFFFFSRLA